VGSTPTASTTIFHAFYESMEGWNARRIKRIKMNEDADYTLLHVDMMGFAALTEEYPYRLVHSNDGRFHGTSTSKTSEKFMMFQRILDTTIFNYGLKGPVRAMLFSDCAFLEFGNSLLCSLVATELMRDLLIKRIPVRMGIGRGTFYLTKFSTDFADSIVNRSLFFGTAVVRAHAAERCSEPGFRIFVHSSIEPDLGLIRNRLKVLDITQCEQTHWELDFLYEQRNAQETPSADEKDRELFAAIAEMNVPTIPERPRRHYPATISAMNRMRTANGRLTIQVQDYQSASG